MKFLTVFILIASLHVSARTWSQQVTLSEKNAKIEKVFNVIKAQTGYVFFYDAALLQDSKPVTLNVKNEPLENVLKEAFNDQPLAWKTVNKTITVIRKQAAEKTVDILGQRIDVHGKVTDAEGKPLPAVSVMVKGSTRGTSTNSAGEYNLRGIDEDAVLVFSVIGYTSQTIGVKKVEASGNNGIE